ncbi:hypothetical protein ACP70R_043551 [Stipagrostis hirtigluma subsp. patula]
MGCAQGKPSQGSLALSDGRGLDRLKRDNGYYRPAAGASRHSDPLPAAASVESSPPAREPPGRAGFAPASGRNAERTPPDDDATSSSLAAAVAQQQPITPHPPPRREYELVDGWPTWLLDNVPREDLHGIVPKRVDAYDKIEKVGVGGYSVVYKARERETGRVVALKKVLLDASDPESVQFMAREIRMLRRLDHPNVIKLEGVATSRMHIYLVFDFMCSDLARLICRPDQRLTEPQIKSYMQQLLSGLQHCHDRGILHRDIKSANLLIDRHGVLKIGDFGLANFYGPRNRQPLSSCVVTIWYRAPELLLGATDYGVGVDLWSAGCVLAEMFLGEVLMPGGTEVEQLAHIFNLCGSPPDDYWLKMGLPASLNPPEPYKPAMPERLRGLPPSALPLIAALLDFDPAARGTAALALQSDFFSTPPLPCDLASLPVVHEEEAAIVQEREAGKARSGQGSEGNGAISVVDASTSVPESSEDAIVNASSSTASKRSLHGLVELLLQEASPAADDAPQDQQPRRASSHSGDDHENHHQLLPAQGGDDLQAGGEPWLGGSGGVTVSSGGLESRPPPASMKDFQAAAGVLCGSSDLPFKQYVLLVDHV